MGHQRQQQQRGVVGVRLCWLRVASLFLVALRGVDRLGVRALEVRVADVTKTSFIEQLQEPQYVVALRPGMPTAGGAAGSSGGEDEDGMMLEPVVMTDKDGKKWRCSLPPVHDPKDSGSASGDGSGNEPKEKSPADYLQLLSSTCFYRVEGWWTYELCYMKKIRQYHQEKIAVEAEFILGEFDADASEAMEAEFAKRPEGEAKYFSQKYKGGTPCDITHTPRETEVRFTCGAEQTNILTSIKEPSTCAYVIVFTTPLLCNHPAFRKKAVQATPIYCDSLDVGGPAAPGTSAAATASTSDEDEETQGGNGGRSEELTENTDGGHHEAAMKASMERVAKALASVFSDAVDEAAVELGEGAAAAAADDGGGDDNDDDDGGDDDEGGGSREGGTAVEGEEAAGDEASDADVVNEGEQDEGNAGSSPAEMLDSAAAAEVEEDYEDYTYAKEDEEDEADQRKADRKDEL